jgi:O-antigen/teichoic acid export membrane protein
MKILALWNNFRRTKTFGKDLLLTMCANLTIAALGVASGTILARMLGPAGRGELAAIQNLYWLIAIVGMLGMPEATLYFTARSPEKIGTILISSLVLVCLAAPLFFVVAFASVPILLAAQSQSTIEVARWVLMAGPLYAFSVIPLFALRGRNDLPLWNALRVLPTFCWLLLLVIVWRTFTPTSRNLSIGYLVIIGLTLVPTAFLIQRHVAGPFKPSLALWKDMLKYGIPLAGATIPLTLNLRLDQMLMGALLPSAYLGYYVVAVAWSGAVTPLLTAIANVLCPKIAAAETREKGTSVFARGLRLSIIVAGLLVFTLSLATPFAIPLLFGVAFAPSVPAGVLLVFATAISGVNIVIEEGLRGLGLPRSVLWGELSGLLVTAITLALLLRPAGIMGAAIASFVGYLSTGCILLAQVRANTQARISDLVVPTKADVRLIISSIRGLSSLLRPLPLASVSPAK